VLETAGPEKVESWLKKREGWDEDGVAAEENEHLKQRKLVSKVE
jgi:hypothetical protein